jgi:hypothetical protein
MLYCYTDQVLLLCDKTLKAVVHHDSSVRKIRRVVSLVIQSAHTGSAIVLANRIRSADDALAGRVSSLMTTMQSTYHGEH